MQKKASIFVMIVVFALTALADPTPKPQAATPPTGSSTAKTVGTVVGTGISAVLQAAFPAAATIINAIWGSKTTDKKTASQATPPVTQLQKTSAAQVQQLSADLDTVNIFLVDCVMADRSVIKMQDILAKKTTMSADEQESLKRQWNAASPRITELGKDAAKASARAVSDEYIRRSLLAISETNYGDLTNILDDINNLNKPSSKSADDLRDQLASLEPKLAGVTALSGDIIGEVSTGLHEGAKNMAPSQGPPDEREKAFSDRIEKSRSEYEGVLKEVYGVAPRGMQP
jgi:hypothetical protein